MRSATAVLLTMLALAWLQAGCSGGGRGSSGFDLKEEQVIREVLDSGRCEESDGLLICPSDPDEVEATPTPETHTPVPETPGPTATPEPVVITTLKDVSTLPCVRLGKSSLCAVVFDFTAEHLPPEAVFRVATRSSAPATAWQLQMPPTLRSHTDPPVYFAQVTLDPNFQPNVQVAVLAYLRPVSEVPPVFYSLAESGADLTFVSQTMQIAPVQSLPTPAPTATPVPAEDAAQVTYLGLVDSRRVAAEADATDATGRPIFLHPQDGGMALVIEAAPGPDGHAVGLQAYEAGGGLPDLQVILSRPLGDGSPEVCDIDRGRSGGVPATQPFSFQMSTAFADAVNDLGCRVNDGSSAPRGQIESELACTRGDNASGFGFVDPTSSAQFCLPLSTAWDFPFGDTIVAARVRDRAGHEGVPHEIVVRRAAE